MTGALGVKAPTDYSVWTAAAAAFLLGVVALRESGLALETPMKGLGIGQQLAWLAKKTKKRHETCGFGDPTQP
jgi:hypothetical protein